jgi:hypothetical protein
MASSSLKVFGLNCSLKTSSDNETSSTDAPMNQLFAVLAENDERRYCPGGRSQHQT